MLLHKKYIYIQAGSQSQTQWFKGLLLVLRGFFILAGDKGSLRNKKKQKNKKRILICPTLIIFISIAEVFLFRLNLGRWKIGIVWFCLCCLMKLITEDLLMLWWGDVYNLQSSPTQRKLPEGPARQKRLQMSWSIDLSDEILHGYLEIPFFYTLPTMNEQQINYDGTVRQVSNYRNSFKLDGPLQHLMAVNCCHLTQKTHYRLTFAQQN